jgi:peptidoglycan/xylan/chitin deacetylase (PgdA/CDA1 family)
VEAASWPALRDAVSTGLVAIESHTHTHRLQHTVTAEAAADELDRSIDRIAAEIGRPPSHFAYPKAVRGNAVARAAVASRFRSAALAGNRTNRRSSDLHRLGRTPVSRGDDITMFARLCDGGLRVEGIARDLRGRRRYRKATT